MDDYYAALDVKITAEDEAVVDGWVTPGHARCIKVSRERASGRGADRFGSNAVQHHLLDHGRNAQAGDASSAFGVHHAGQHAEQHLRQRRRRHVHAEGAFALPPQDDRVRRFLIPRPAV
ncbi:hypothetical protein G6F35_016919 [Rhizopus arrhizus]|nr:hypothetical protein G6F35_016919 [Rhizopus arrhizus]